MQVEPKMLEAIRQILSVNTNCALVGGNSFLLQKKKIRRQPTDIDIYCPDGIFKIIPGMSMPKIDEIKKDEDKYDEEDDNSVDTRICYLFDGFKVDVFTPKNQPGKNDIKKVDGIKVCSIQDTIAAKVRYFECGGKSKGKHRLDIMYYLLMN